MAELAGGKPLKILLQLSVMFYLSMGTVGNQIVCKNSIYNKA